MSLGVPVSWIDLSTTQKVPYLAVSDVLKVLAEKYPYILLGGAELGEHTKINECFWETFEGLQPDHRVFTEHASHLGDVVALLIHGDKGRTHKDAPITVVDAEVVLGQKNVTELMRLAIVVHSHRSIHEFCKLQ